LFSEISSASGPSKAAQLSPSMQPDASMMLSVFWSAIMDKSVMKLLRNLSNGTIFPANVCVFSAGFRARTPNI
jgi:hypothetical protein